jgi:hypothetical protein
MRRREFISLLGSAMTWPLGVRAQGKTHVTGILETISPELNAANIDALRRGLRELAPHLGASLEAVSSACRTILWKSIAR